MGPVKHAAIFFFCAMSPLAFGQLPSEPAEAEAPARGERPLTPEQIRDKQIKMFDPLDKSDPLLGNRDQDPKDPTPAATAPARQPSVTPPLPGSVAASSAANPPNPRSAGPQVVSDQGEAPVQEYSGPAVLSRSYTISRPTTPRTVRWSPYLGFTEIYDTGLTQPSTVSGGPLQSASGFGYGGTWGISGRHYWKQDQLGLDYHGSANRYGGYNAYNGVNQSLNLDYTHAVSRHLSLNIVSTGAILSQNSALDNQLMTFGNSVANVNLNLSPATQILDQGIRQWMNQASVTWQKSARLSFNAGGGVFFVDRTGFAPIGNTGYQAQGDVNYRYTRKTTVGAYYSFTDYSYSHQLDVANFHTLGGIYSYALNRTTQFRLRAGASWLENQGLQSVRIDPSIAALLGQTQGVISAYQRNVISDLSAQFAKDFGRNRTASISYARGIAPGNGALLTSVQDSLGATFSMLVARKYRVDFGGGRSSLSAVSQLNGGKYDSQYFTAGISRAYSHGLTGNFRFDYRRFNLTGQPNLDSQLRISTGISWSPGENWLKSW